MSCVENSTFHTTPRQVKTQDKSCRACANNYHLLWPVSQSARAEKLAIDLKTYMHDSCARTTENSFVATRYLQHELRQHFFQSLEKQLLKSALPDPLIL